METKVPSCYIILGFKECADPALLHSTVLYMGEWSPEKESKVLTYLNERLKDGFEETPVVFDEEKMFGVEQNVRVLKSKTNENFFPDFRDALADLNASQFKDYQPHITTDLPLPQYLTIDRVMFSKDEYTPIKTWYANKASGKDKNY